jgi:hypothetical protein
MRPCVALPAGTHYSNLDIVDFHLETPCFRLMTISKLRRREDLYGRIIQRPRVLGPSSFSRFKGGQPMFR